eukprot:CAMPEP_0114356984 /NCGR_PEP_ID=MMETSP0101-20121206/21324_1 /TAXON_ID=38822 ORGANISM="Pteridomonas danica, Strain PT" /NCGR_SAMPLE_ID=MMETSP0101 /ASSEMBLY_ACC=CAM_ASM_000211 /LENGTH=322 /DNA_ID=CAMNT_0001499595 /DNA_START=58 /DNA_END=1023 /DNA_ORIENTATION=+
MFNFGFGGGMGMGPQSFDEEYHCFPGAFADKPELEEGDKILLPASALDTLTRLNIQYPMTFEITAPNGGRTHCSVLEFTAPEGTVYLPYWMMSNLTLTEGRRIKIRNVSLPKATFVKFQPQSVDFLEISNHRAVLEYKLRSFSCVTVGDHIPFTYNDQKYYLEVREVKPQDAACIIEADVNVDFDPPVGYKEPERLPVAPPKVLLPEVQKASLVDEKEEEGPTFKAFTGDAVRLDGKPLKKAQLTAVEEAGPAPDRNQQASSNYEWGEGVGTVKSGNDAASRRAAMLAAAEKRNSSSSLSSASTSSSVTSPPKVKTAAPTKW